MRVSQIGLLFITLTAVFMSGCAQKRVAIKMLEPAEVGVLANKKHIAVAKFKNDTVGLAGKIEANLANATVDGKKYFTVVNRQQMNKILAEQKLQSSEMIDPSTASKIGKLIGVQAMITGEVASATGTMGSYLQDRKECLRYYKDGSGCAQWHFYKVRCHTTTATVSANMSIIDVETAAVLYGDSYNKTYSADSCKAGQTTLAGLLTFDTGPKQILSKNQAINKLTEYIAHDFALKLVPHYVTLNVNLLEDLDFDANDAQKKRFEYALKYINAGRAKKAEKMLQQLLDEVDGNSAVIAYDLGVVKEALGKLDEAQKLYQLADDKTIEPVEEINQAILRIQSAIEKRKKAAEQMGK